jgi:hypothetical protein
MVEHGTPKKRQFAPPQTILRRLVMLHATRAPRSPGDDRPLFGLNGATIAY